MSRIIAIDFETGGVEPGTSAHVSLGVALMEADAVINSAEWTFAPVKDWKGNDRRKYDIRALEVSGTTWKQILAGDPLRVILAQFSDHADHWEAQRLPVVAFNASFDLAMYSDMLFLAGEYNRQTQSFDHVKPPLVGPWHCARLLAQTQIHCADYKLDTVASKLDLGRTGNRHGALEDAILAGLIFNKLAELRK